MSPGSSTESYPAFAHIGLRKRKLTTRDSIFNQEERKRESFPIQPKAAVTISSAVVSGGHLQWSGIRGRKTLLGVPEATDPVSRKIEKKNRKIEGELGGKFKRRGKKCVVVLKMSKRVFNVCQHIRDRPEVFDKLCGFLRRRAEGCVMIRLRSWAQKRMKFRTHGYSAVLVE
ncbi:hypothetical protein ANN_19722 [Periplaneta americana]|uniref:Uncharacterized protein n=1 Tax=Periplaneta americana TaxID=6978 RepID=A0ABQ8SAN8_PERAM|nr:hypothetical protein ANN_19722 [Periplaneta americana]